MKSMLFQREKSIFKLRAFLLMPVLALGMTQVKAQYCSVAGGDCSYESIDEVSLSNLSRTSTCDNLMGYVDYTGDTAQLVHGQTVTLEVTITPDESDYITAWIDWNQDGDFEDSGEEYVVVEDIGGTGPYTKNIYIPASAAIGVTHMRVSLTWDTIPAPCETPDFGEVEDYRVRVSATAGTDDPAFDDVVTMYPNPVADQLYLEYKDSREHEVAIFNLEGKLLYEENSRNSTEIPFSDFPAGVYFIRVDNKMSKVIKQ